MTVQTESEKKIDKLRRKEEKRVRRGEYGAEGVLSSVNFASLLQASEKKAIFDDIIGSGDSIITGLPKGTIRTTNKGYEEVKIPPTPTAEMKPGEKLVRGYVFVTCVQILSGHRMPCVNVFDKHLLHYSFC